MKTCIVCKYTKFELISPHVRDSLEHEVIRCKKCKHLQLYPIPTQAEDDKFYDENLQDKNVNDVGSIKRAHNKMIEDTIRRADIISKLTPRKGNILEIGSGHGFFLEMMNKKGYKIIGIDISKEKRRIAKKITKVKVLDINVNEQMPRIGCFDTIVMFHVLEHIANPIGFLENVRKFLKPKGKIIVEVPNCDDFQLKLNKEYKKFYWQRAHLSYFTPRILRRVFLHSQLVQIKIIGTQRYSVENMFNWKLTNKPQIDEPTYNLPKDYEWIEKPYKHNLEKNLMCDTILAVGTNSGKNII